MSDHDIDQTLADWFHADASAAEPADGVRHALEGVRRSRPRPAWLAGAGSHWGWEAPKAASRVGAQAFPRSLGRLSTALVVVAVLGVILGGTLLVGARVLEPAPAPIPRLGSLAYAADGDIFVADWDGRNPVRIADGPAHGEGGCGPGQFYAEGSMWSPDGRFLAYRGDQEACRQPFADTVYLSDPAGNVVAEFPGVGWLIAWSPDSTRVATWLDRYPATKIGVYGLDGVRQAVLSLPPSMDGMAEGDNDPVWSPDGESILFPVPGSGTTATWEAPVDGSAPRPLPADHPRSRWKSTLSPDGTRIAYVLRYLRMSGQGPAPELVVAAADGSQPRALASDVDEQWWDYPVWSPTGDRIAFVAEDQTELRIVDVVTGDDTMLVRTRGREGVQVIGFSPEGDRILFTGHSTEDGRTSSVWSVDAAGSAPQLLIEEPVEWRAGDWQSLQSE